MTSGALAPALRAAAVRELELRECHGFTVEGPGGRIGVVEDVLFDSRDRPTALRIAAGLMGRRLVVFPVAAVARVYPRERRVRLVAHPTPLASYRGDGHPSWPQL